MTAACIHFWSAWYLVAPKVAERRCYYCDEREREGEAT